MAFPTDFFELKYVSLYPLSCYSGKTIRGSKRAVKGGPLRR